MPEMSIILPCYNEAGNLKNILERFRSLAASSSFELILVNNGSTDGSSEVLREELSKPENGFARTVFVQKNIGYGFGLKSGLMEAKAEVVAFSHADLQTPPEDLVAALDHYRREAKKGPCLVKGRRCGRRPFLDRLVTWFYNHMAMVLLGIRVIPCTKEGTHFPARFSDVNAEPKLFHRSFLESLKESPDDFTYDLYVLMVCARKGMPIYEFDVRYELRSWGKSKLAANPWVRLKTSMNAFRKMWEWCRIKDLIRLRCCR